MGFRKFYREKWVIVYMIGNILHRSDCFMTGMSKFSGKEIVYSYVYCLSEYRILIYYSEFEIVVKKNN